MRSAAQHSFAPARRINRQVMKAFEIEPIRKMHSTVASTPVSRVSIPAARSQNFPSFQTAIEMAGIPFSRTRSSAYFCKSWIMKAAFYVSCNLRIRVAAVYAESPSTPPSKPNPDCLCGSTPAGGAPGSPERDWMESTCAASIE